MRNLFRESIARGEHCLGTFSCLGSGSAIEALAYTGMDFVIIDAEHGPFEAERVQDLIRAAELHRITPFVRVKDSGRASILKMLDAGAKALVIPQIHSSDQVKEVVMHGKYHPIGNRGFALGRTSGYGNEPFAHENGISGYFEHCNRETLLFPQCETKGCLEEIEEIVSINGVDGIFVGPYDLSIALERPGAFDAPEFQSAIDRILAAVRGAGKIAIMFTSAPGDVSRYVQMGFQAVTLSTDIQLLITQTKKLLSSLRI